MGVDLEEGRSGGGWRCPSWGSRRASCRNTKQEGAEREKLHALLSRWPTLLWAVP